MTTSLATALADLHARCFTTPRPWSAAEIAGLMLDPLNFTLIEGEAAAPTGFLIGRTIADEAELLTVAVAPEARREGLGRKLLLRFEDAARARGAATAFLEVAADNAPAQALYATRGFAQTGLRKAYYHHPDGQSVDALVMGRPLHPAS